MVTSGKSLSTKQRRLMVTIYHYLVAARLVDFSKKQLAGRLGVSERDIGNVVDRAGVAGSNAFYELLKGILKDNARKIDPSLAPLIYQVFGDEVRISDQYGWGPEDILRACTYDDAEYLASISERYRGVYKIYRYAAHSAAAGLPSDTPSVILASLSISPYKEGKTHLEFQIRYRPRQKMRFHHTKIHGGVSIIKNHLYFVGKEDMTGFPLIMATKIEEDVSGKIFAMVLRFHEFKHTFLASRVVLTKQDCKKIDELDEFIGRYKENDIEENEVNLEDFVNHIKHGGRSALVL